MHLQAGPQMYLELPAGGNVELVGRQMKKGAVLARWVWLQCGWPGLLVLQGWRGITVQLFPVRVPEVPDQSEETASPDQPASDRTARIHK